MLSIISCNLCIAYCPGDVEHLALHCVRGVFFRFTVPRASYEDSTEVKRLPWFFQYIVIPNQGQNGFFLDNQGLISSLKRIARI